MTTDNSSSRQQSAERAQGSTTQYGSSGTGQRTGQSGAGAQGTQSQAATQGTQGGYAGGESRPAYGSAAQGDRNQHGQWGRQGSSQPRYGLQRRGGYDASEYGTGYGGYGSGPFSLMRRISDEMDRLFESFGMGRNFLPEELGQGRGRGGLQSATALWSPHLEVFERNGKLVIEADLPGVRRDDVNVQVEQDAVIIQGQRQQQSENNSQAGYYHSERSYGSFYRMIPLPEGVNTEDATATFRNGVLEIEVPMPQQQQRSRRLEVRDAGSGETYQGSGTASGTNLGSSGSASGAGSGTSGGASAGTSGGTAGTGAGTSASSSATSIGGQHGSGGTP
jgi:HSP20 family protein